MASNTTLLTLVQESAKDNNPLILGAVGVGIGGMAMLLFAFKQLAPSTLIISPLFQRVSGLLIGLATKAKQDTSVKQEVATALSEVEKAVSIKVDPAHLADIQAMLQLMGKPHVVSSTPPVDSAPVVVQDATSEQSGPTGTSLPGAMYSTI